MDKKYSTKKEFTQTSFSDIAKIIKVGTAQVVGFTSFATAGAFGLPIIFPATDISIIAASTMGLGMIGMTVACLACAKFIRNNTTKEEEKSL